MGKDRSFAAKVAKGAATSNQCPTCGQVINIVKVINSEKKAEKDIWRFKEKFVQVCNCNEKEVYS